MASVSLTGQDSVVFFRAGTPLVLSGFADGDTVMLEYPNNSVEAKPGKNGNVLFAFNATGVLVNATLRLLLGTNDDKFFNSRFAELQNDISSFILMEAEFVKRVGDGAGNITSVTYRLGGGIIQKPPAVKENVEGDTEQSVVVWNILFTNSNRIIA